MLSPFCLGHSLIVVIECTSTFILAKAIMISFSGLKG